ncbi:glycerol kinase GlpK [Planctomycetes bacterium K23_9]|uniref:Glycerol kinase n=1 Tax=Stieleria marina TaxID=1930275 RepID=A0A517NT22_9BACT|nr:Glycerol kinase [Planctomycetes bacterium K23_9]
MKFVLALDQGTTSSRAILFDSRGQVAGIVQREFPQHFPQAGWVEHDPEDIWKTQLAVAKSVLRKSKASAKDVVAIGITNQRETTVVWDRATGKPIHNAIVWQDRRTANICEELRRQKLDRTIQKKTGLILDAYFSGTKIKWILDNVKGARRKAEAGELAFGTIDSFLLWRLTDGRVHMTDATNASRTMLYNIKTQKWDRPLLAALDIPAAMLPEVRSCSEVYAETTHLGAAIPIAGMAGDQHAALFGQVCTKPGMVKNTYGTGCFMLMNTGTEPIVSKNKLLTTTAWKIGDKTHYALEGSIFIAGAVVQWLRDGLGIIKTSAEIEKLACQVPDTDGVMMVPAFAGLGAPHWDPYARGTIHGLTRGTTKAHLARAALESIAFQTADVVRAMEADSGIKLKQLRVDGGAAMNDLLMQFQSDLLGVDVVRPEVNETTALGAAYLAGLAVGFWKNQKEIGQQWQESARYKPKMKPATRRQLQTQWNRAVDRSGGWTVDS